MDSTAVRMCATEMKKDMSDEIELAKALRVLRQRSGFTGEFLGAKIGISQPKISRIESGRQVPTLEEAELWLQETNASREECVNVLAYLRTILSRSTTDHLSFAGTSRHPQRELVSIESTTKHVRAYCPDMIFSLLQTPEYATAVMTATPNASDEATLAQAIQERLMRQQILQGSDRKFEIILAEHMLRVRTLSDEGSLLQINHLIKMAKQDNIEIGVLLDSTVANIQRYLSFVVYDDVAFSTDVVTGLVLFSHPLDIAYASRNFEVIKEASIWGENAISLLEGNAGIFTS